jgi:5-methyltetrahydropteroyltriglutamate--homocysteine methyltransferase
MVVAANLGVPRIGPDRELKKSLEGFLKGDNSAADLQSTA